MSSRQIFHSKWQEKAVTIILRDQSRGERIRRGLHLKKNASIKKKKKQKCVWEKKGGEIATLNHSGFLIAMPQLL